MRRHVLPRLSGLRVVAAVVATVAVVGAAAWVVARSPASTVDAAAPAASGGEPVAVVPFADVPSAGCCEEYPPRGPVPTCDPAALRVTASARPDELGTRLEVVLRNAGTVACDVPFVGDLTLLSGTEVVALGRLGSNTLAARRPPPPVPPDGSVVMTGSWRRPCEPSRRADRLRLEPVDPRGAPFAPIEVTFNDAPATACVNDQGERGGGPVGLFDYSVLDAAGRIAGEPTKSLVASLVDVPESVARGEVLRFGVRLDNPTRGDIALADGCPDHAVTFAATGVSSRPLIDGRLNCDAAPAVVPAGRGVVFLLEVRVPQGPEIRTLTWTRTDEGTAGLSARVRVTAPADPARVTVLLHHCGVQDLDYDGELWEVVRPPFDAGSAPDGFTGAGVVERVGDELRYTDEQGARLTFTIDDGVGASCA